VLEGLNWGRRRAAGAAPALLILLLLLGCATGEEEGHHDAGPMVLPPVPNASDGQLKELAEMTEGACLNGTNATDSGQRRRVLPCSSPHRYEVYAILKLSNPSRAEQERVREAIPRCEEELQRVLKASAGVDRKQLMIDALDDYRAEARQRTVACAVAYNDFRQVDAVILPQGSSAVTE
jgi:hypothetical protein